MTGQPALQGLTVIDCSTLFAGPLGGDGARRLRRRGDQSGAPEAPGPEPGARPAPWTGIGLWWKMLGRNKYPVTIDLSAKEGAELLLGLAATADVMIENFRPGTLERWGIGPEATARGG